MKPPRCSVHGSRARRLSVRAYLSWAPLHGVWEIAKIIRVRQFCDKSVLPTVSTSRGCSNVRVTPALASYARHVLASTVDACPGQEPACPHCREAVTGPLARTFHILLGVQDQPSVILEDMTCPHCNSRMRPEMRAIPRHELLEVAAEGGQSLRRRLRRQGLDPERQSHGD